MPSTLIDARGCFRGSRLLSSLRVAVPTALAMATTFAPARAQNWTQVSTQGPPSLESSVMAYDEAAGVTIMFGGKSGSIPSSQTWEWNGTAWRALAGGGPSPRFDAAMAYDAQRRRMVMTGAGRSADVWEWDGSTWTDVTPASGPMPPNTWEAQMVYDRARGVCVLFGGFGPAGLSNDTWEWDGQAWTQVSTVSRPAPRAGFGMAYDSIRQRTVLFGGTGGWSAGELADTWEYDGVDWSPVNPAVSPAARQSCAMVFDSSSGRCVLYGGHRALPYSVVADTWEFDGTNWSMVVGTEVIPARSGAALAYDTRNGRTVLYGGSRPQYSTLPTTNTYEFSSGSSAGYSNFGYGCPGSAGVPRLVGRTVPTIGSTLVVDVIDLPSQGGQAFMMLGFSRDVWNGLPLPVDLSAYRMHGCMVFIDASAGFALTHTAGVATWAIPVPATASLFGARFYNQAWSVDPLAARLVDAAVSDAAEGVIR